MNRRYSIGLERILMQQVANSLNLSLIQVISMQDALIFAEKDTEQDTAIILKGITHSTQLPQTRQKKP